MYRLKLLAKDYEALRHHLLRGPNADEEAAFLLASTAVHAQGKDWIVREVVPVPDDALLQKGRAGLQIDPLFIARVLKRARTEALSIFLCHSHPFSRHGVAFSGIDDAGEAALFPRLLMQVQGVGHGACVFGQKSLDARVWLDIERRVPIDVVVVVGRQHEMHVPTSADEADVAPTADEFIRQALALGDVGQMAIARLRVGFVGAGGLGSVMYDALMRMGMRKLVLVDADVLSKSNISREVNASARDVGRLKVDVLGDAATRVGLGATVRTVAEWAQHEAALGELLACDVIVLATDNMKSRVYVSRLGVQYQIPVLSVGVDIVPGEGDRIAAVGGHVVWQLPDGPCLDCLGLIDRRVLEAEEMSPETRQAHAYVRGHDPDAPVPSVIVFNQTVGGLAGGEILQYATGRLRVDARPSYLMFNGQTGESRRVATKAIRSCGDVCTQLRGCADRYRPTGAP